MRYVTAGLLSPIASAASDLRQPFAGMPVMSLSLFRLDSEPMKVQTSTVQCLSSAPTDGAEVADKVEWEISV